jgi:hypothetical protein
MDMRTSKIAEFVAIPHRDDDIRVRSARHRQAGVTALLLFFLLVLTASPVLAADIAAAPNPFNKSAPANNATNVPINPTLSWNNSAGTQYFQYCIDTSLNSTCDGGEPSWISTGLSVTVDLTSLTNGLTYEWQVRAHNVDGDTYANNGVWWRFTTVVDSPGTFSKISPVDDSSGQATSLTLSWETSSGATSYEYCYDSNVNNKCQSWVSTTNTSVVISGLTNDYNYEWQVRAVNANPVMTYANSDTYWQFTTIVAPPGSFGKINPADAAVNQPDTVSLTWDASARATSYEYCYYDTALASSCPGDIWTSTGLALTASITGLEYEHVYAWQVRAKNTNPQITYADASTWWTFTVQAEPGAFTKYIPHIASINQPTTLVISWSAWSGGGTVINYEYCVDSVIDDSCGTAGNGTWINTVLDTGDQVDLAIGTLYEWQVRVHIGTSTYYTNAGETPEWWTFTTVEAPPGAFSKITPGDGAINQPLNLTLTWSESSGATSYLYCLETTQFPDTCNTPWISVSDPIIDGTVSVVIAGLTYNADYEWQVKAINNNPTESLADAGDWFNFSTVVPPPGNFYKISPVNGETDQALDLTLNWGTSGSASSYEYCVDAVIDQSCGSGGNGTWISTGTLKTASPAGLVNGTQYEWQVRSKNANPNPTYADSDTWWTFTTIVAPPGAFTKVSPVHGASDQVPSSVTLQWNASAGAATYWYCVDTTVNSTCDGSWVYAGTGTSTTITGLTFNTVYQWQIRAVNANPTMTYADSNLWWTFTTRLGTLPNGFSKSYPLDFTTDLPTTLNLQWNASTYASYYEYCYDTNLAVGHIDVCDGTWINNGSTRQATLSGLALDTEYEWQVRAWNDTVGPTYANSGDFFSFRTVVVNPPGAFEKSSPVDEAGDQALSLTLAWTPSTDVDIYEYCIDNNPGNSCNTSWVTTTDTSVPVSGLSYGTEYEWQVRAYRDGNPNPTLADNGTWWTFTTVIAPPGPFNKLGPANGAIDQPGSLSLSWSASSAADGYEFCYEVYDGNTTCEGSWISTPLTSAGITGLSNATVYGWQVRAINDNPAFTYADNNSWYQFTTAIAPPEDFSKSAPVNEALSQPLNLTLSWAANPGASSYAWCYDATINGLCSGSWISTTATSASLSGLAYATEYEWQVRAVNIGGTVYANEGETPEWWTFTTVVAPPAAFVKSTPAKGASGQPIDLSLTWEPSSGATGGYEYCIDTTLDSNCDGDTWVPAAGLSADPAGLVYATSYQWQVRAVNDNPTPTYADSGTWWIFTTVIAPPGPFGKLNPDYNVINQPTSQYLTWEPSSDALTYEYCIDADIDATCDDTWQSTHLLYANVPGLLNSTVYEWQVRSVNNNGTTDADAGGEHEWWIFEVEGEPSTISKANPNHLAINQPTALTITWTSASGATGYEYCYDDILNDTCDSTIWTDSSNPLFTNLSLENGTTYEWQVRANTGGGDVYANAGETPEWWTFTTVEPAAGAFTKDAPLDTATAAPANNLTLSWDPSAGATGYQYCIDSNTTNDLCDTYWITVGNATSVSLSNLSYSTEYAWQVRATNNNPNITVADTGDWWVFTTIIAPPQAFTKSLPANQVLNTMVDLTISWEAASGATNGYEYCVDTTIDSLCAGENWIATTNTTVNLYGLPHDTQHEWQVLALSANLDEPVAANGGTWFGFRTVVAAPGEFSKSSPADLAINQPTDMLIRWNSSPGATGYEYCIDKNLANPDCDGIWVKTSFTQAIVSGLSYKTEYEWHVRATNANPTTTYSNTDTWWTFNTISLHSFIPMVLKPGLRAPVLNPVTIGSLYNNQYTLSWNTVEGATSYKIWESTTPTFPTEPTYQGITSTSFVLPTGVNPTRYYYAVAAANTTQVGPRSNSITVDRQYELEDNDSKLTSNGVIFYNVNYYGQPNDQKDWYKVFIDTPGTITVTLTNYPVTIPTWPGQLQLLNDNLEAVASDTNPSGSMQLTYTVIPEKIGWYYVYIPIANGAYYSSWYTLRATFTPTP